MTERISQKKDDKVTDSNVATLTPDTSQVNEPVAVKEVVTKTVLMTELDSYIKERSDTQPTVEEVRTRLPQLDRNRLSLPKELEHYSYDHVRPDGSRGQFVFRWVWKEKRAVDGALNVRGWIFVNRTGFKDLPRFLFSTTGCIEEGDSILMYMPWKQAIAIRTEPARVSKERLNSTIRKGKRQNTVVMNTDENSEVFYEPKLTAKEKSDIDFE